ncbi:NAD(P)-dependent oxidoreductase [Reyranella sp.]|jgi:nucleoside-diphosphate-sugar epimerase|uniref:NAD-dependent epimerase/dehydratase family protein n=1 Tax=Reyranella sp. TaxID=1929291 RepID=UPI002F930612
MCETTDARAGGRLVLVTGATGRIGKHVVNELLRRGFKVRAISSGRRADNERSEGVEWRSKDFSTSIDFDCDLEGCDAVIHLAAEIAERSRMQRVNVEATRALASASERAGVAVFCYTSSASVYGNSLSRIVTEESPTLTPDRDIKSEYGAPDFLRAYGRTKLLGEIALREEARSAEYVILRPTMVVDVDDVLRLGDLGHIRRSLTARRHAHYIYVADVADVIVSLVERGLIRHGPTAHVSTYNVAEDEFPECSYAAIFRKLRKSTGDRKFEVLPAPMIADRLVSFARFGALPVRFTFGQMLFATNKLKNEGYPPRFGLEQLYRQAIRQMSEVPRRP